MFEMCCQWFHASRSRWLRWCALKLLPCSSCDLSHRHYVFISLAHFSEEQLTADEGYRWEVQSQDSFWVATMMRAASPNKHLLQLKNIQCIQLFIWRHVISSSLVLERKMSTRQSREELIKKGVLKEVYEKGETTKVKNKMCPWWKTPWCWNDRLNNQLSVWHFENYLRFSSYSLSVVTFLLLSASCNFWKMWWFQSVTKAGN